MEAPDTSGRVPWWARIRGHRWTSIERAGVIAAMAIVMGSLFVTTYTLALGDPVPRRIDAALVGDTRGNARTVKAVQDRALDQRQRKRGRESEGATNPVQRRSGRPPASARVWKTVMKPTIVATSIR